MKTFYGGIFIEKRKLEEEGITHPIKLEYYKTINEREKYGIEVIKTEYLKEEVRIEKKDIKHFTYNEKEANKILDILKQNEVTPVGIVDVINDLRVEKIMLDMC